MKNKLVIMLFTWQAILITSCVQSTNSNEQITNNQDSSFSENSTFKAQTIINQNCISQLIEAAKKNDLKSAIELLGNGCDANGKLLVGIDIWESPLRNSVHHNSSEMVKLLLKYGADPNISLGKNLSPFHYAAGCSNSIFKLLFEYGGNVNTLNKESGWGTPLIWAISNGSIDNVKFLIERGVSLEPDSFNGFISPLSKAVSNKQYEIAQLLLDSGVNMDATFSEGSDDCMPCPYGITVMHQIVDMTIHGENTSQLLDLLLKHKPNLNLESNDGFTPLEHACFSENVALVDRLISSGANLHSQNYSALHCAAMISNYKMTKHLLEKGADPNDKDNNGNNALIINYDCCGDGFGDGIKIEDRVSTIELLLDSKVNPYSRNNEGKSFLDKCINGHRKELKELIIRRGLLKEKG